MENCKKKNPEKCMNKILLINLGFFLPIENCLGFFLPIENCLAKVFFTPYFTVNFRTTSDRSKLRQYLESAALN